MSSNNKLALKKNEKEKKMEACMFDIQIDITIFIPLSNDNKFESSQPKKKKKV